MPLLASHTLVLAHTLTLLATSTILLTNPSLLTSSAPIWLIGEAMHIRDTPSFSLPSEPLAGLALVLAVLAVVEGVFAGGLATGQTNPSSAKSRDAADMNVVGGGGGVSIQAFAERAAVLHSVQGGWVTVSTIQALAFGLLVMYSYLTSPREQGMGYVVQVERGGGLLGMLNNRVIFVGVFAEMLFWGHLWTVLKEEARELAGRIAARREEGRQRGEEDWDR